MGEGLTGVQTVERRLAHVEAVPAESIGCLIVNLALLNPAHLDCIFLVELIHPPLRSRNPIKVQLAGQELLIGKLGVADDIPANRAKIINALEVRIVLVPVIFPPSDHDRLALFNVLAFQLVRACSGRELPVPLVHIGLAVHADVGGRVYVAPRNRKQALPAGLLGTDLNRQAIENLHLFDEFAVILGNRWILAVGVHVVLEGGGDVIRRHRPTIGPASLGVDTKTKGLATVVQLPVRCEPRNIIADCVVVPHEGFVNEPVDGCKRKKP